MKDKISTLKASLDRKSREAAKFKKLPNSAPRKKKEPPLKDPAIFDPKKYDNWLF